jgi:hypothetical protein
MNKIRSSGDKVGLVVLVAFLQGQVALAESCSLLNVGDLAKPTYVVSRKSPDQTNSPPLIQNKFDLLEDTRVDLGYEGLGCVKAELSDRELQSEIEDLLKNLGAQGDSNERLNVKDWCHSGGLIENARNKGSISKSVARFLEAAAIITEKENYKYADLEKFSDAVLRMQDFVSKVETKRGLEKYEKYRGKLDEKSSKAVVEAANIVAIEGMFGVGAQVSVGAATRAAKGGLKTAKAVGGSNTSEEEERGTSFDHKIPLEKLLPFNSHKLTVINAVAGSGMVLCGLGGIALAASTKGVGTYVFTIPGAAIEIASSLAEEAVTNNNQRKRRLLKAERGLVRRAGKNTKKGLTEGTDSAFEVGHESAMEYAVVHPADHAVQAAESGEGSASVADIIGAEVIGNAVPLIGPIYQVTRGGKKLYKAFMGSEKGQEILRAYEVLYGEVIRQAIQGRRDEIAQLLNQAYHLLDKDGKANDKLTEKKYLILSQINCLCRALAWMDDFQKKSDAAFKSRRKYLDTRIARKRAKDELFNDVYTYFGRGLESAQIDKLKSVSSRLEKYKQELESNYDELFREYAGWNLSKDEDPDLLRKKLDARLQRRIDSWKKGPEKGPDERAQGEQGAEDLETANRLRQTLLELANGKDLAAKKRASLHIVRDFGELDDVVLSFLANRPQADPQFATDTYQNDLEEYGATLPEGERKEILTLVNRYVSGHPEREVLSIDDIIVMRKLAIKQATGKKLKYESEAEEAFAKFSAHRISKAKREYERYQQAYRKDKEVEKDIMALQSKFERTATGLAALTSDSLSLSKTLQTPTRNSKLKGELKVVEYKLHEQVIDLTIDINALEKRHQALLDAMVTSVKKKMGESAVEGATLDLETLKIEKMPFSQRLLTRTFLDSWNSTRRRRLEAIDNATQRVLHLKKEADQEGLDLETLE